MMDKPPMGKIIKFPGKFNTLEDLDQNPVLRDKKTGKYIVLDDDEMEKIKFFFIEITDVMEKNPNFLSVVNKNDNKPIDKYTDRELLDLALRATDKELKQRSFFYALIAKELHDRLKKNN